MTSLFEMTLTARNPITNDLFSHFVADYHNFSSVVLQGHSSSNHPNASLMAELNFIALV